MSGVAGVNCSDMVTGVDAAHSASLFIEKGHVRSIPSYVASFHFNSDLTEIDVDCYRHTYWRT